MYLPSKYLTLLILEGALQFIEALIMVVLSVYQIQSSPLELPNNGQLL